MLGGAGLCTCLTFLWFSAPDLALTQLVVEVATTVLMLLGLRWMPKRDKSLHIPVLSAELRARSRRMRDLLNRKSTRLNSSHLVISYAVFCLKKKYGRRYTHSSSALALLCLSSLHSVHFFLLFFF